MLVTLVTLSRFHFFFILRYSAGEIPNCSVKVR